MVAQWPQVVDKLLFPTPESTYTINSFPEELVYVPKNLRREDARAEDCVPCLLLPFPSARFFILYFHSNAEDLGHCHTFCNLLRCQFQVHVLAVEYPGYGVCPGGQADEQSVIENANLAFRFLVEVLHWPKDEIIVFGRSIGCGPALNIAAKYHVYGVILVCPFKSVQELCREYFGVIANAIAERFPNKDLVAKIRSPLLLVHGKQDRVVPWTHGRELYEKCRSRKRLVTPEKMNHNTNLHADATYFVLPMLQFFGLPDYSFDEMRIPAWLFDKRLSTHYTEGMENTVASEELDPGGFVSPMPTSDAAWFDASQLASLQGFKVPGEPLPGLAPPPRPHNAGERPPDAHCDAASSSGSTAGSSCPRVEPDSPGSPGVQEVTEQAVERFLQSGGVALIKPSNPNLKVARRKPATQDEPPSAPDDLGYRKVPVSGCGGRGPGAAHERSGGLRLGTGLPTDGTEHCALRCGYGTNQSCHRLQI